MKVNVQMGLLGYAGLCLAPLRAAAQSEFQLRELAGTIGWDLDRITGFPVDELADRLADFVEAADGLLANAEHPPETLPELVEALEAAQHAFDAVRDISAIFATGGAPSQFEEFGRDLIETMTATYLQLGQPVLYHLAVLLTLIEPADNAALAPPVFDGAGNLVRFPHSRPRVRLDRLEDLIDDPVAALRSEYVGPNGLATAADAQHTADRLFPRLAGLLSAVGAETVYGVKPIYGIDLGDPANLAAGMLTCWVASGASDVSVGTTLSLSPAERGDLGVVVSPFGAVELRESFDQWALTAEMTAGVDAVAVGPQGVKLLLAPGSDAARFVARVAAERLPPAEESKALVGSTAGTRLELPQVGVFGTAVLSESERELALSIEVPSAALVLAPADGDGFLNEIFPPEGLRADFDLGVGWSSRSGLTFRGSAGLEAQLTVGASFGPLSVESVFLSIRAADSRIRALVAVAASVQLGPVTALVHRTGLAATVAFPEAGGNLGVADIALGFKPPDGIGLALDAGPVSGGGFLSFDSEHARYAGAVQLRFQGIAAAATGLLTTKLPDRPDGFSLLVLISTEFPPVQLGLGFRLERVGGLLAINRTVAVEALRAGLKAGSLDAVLSPPDPVANASRVVATLAAVFPPAAGRHVFGPTARITWGTPALMTIDLCLALELPSPVRLIALGRLHAVLPDDREPVAVLNMDLLGVIELDRREAAVDATLVDSRLASFALTGDMALRTSWGAEPSFLLAVGGFHPRFAAPPGFPALDRVAVALATGKNPRLRLEAYLALTSNTVQLGARVDLSARAGRFEVAGFLSFDALVQLRPLAFEVAIAARLAVLAGRRTILSVSLELTLSGPAPWRARGRASFSILFFDVSFSFDVTIGPEATPALPAAVDVGALLHAALSDPRAWSAALPAGGDALVTLRSPPRQQELLGHPLGALEIRQRVAPLERTLERFGADVPSGPRRFEIAGATIGGDGITTAPLEDLFAPGQFLALTDEQRLSSPSFAAMTSGARLGDHDLAHGTPVTAELSFEQRVVAAAGAPAQRPVRTGIPGDVLLSLIGDGPAPVTRPFAIRHR